MNHNRPFVNGGKSFYILEPLSKRFSLVKVKADENFNRRNTWSISRIKIFIQRRDWPKWEVLKLAHSNTEYRTTYNKFAIRYTLSALI